MKSFRLCTEVSTRFIGPKSRHSKRGTEGQARATTSHVLPRTDRRHIKNGPQNLQKIRISGPMIKAALGGGRAWEFQTADFAERTWLQGWGARNTRTTQCILKSNQKTWSTYIEFQIMADSFGNVVHLERLLHQDIKGTWNSFRVPWHDKLREDGKGRSKCHAKLPIWKCQNLMSF